jgi:chemotaxis protein MotA
MARKERRKITARRGLSFDYLTLIGVTMAVGAIVGGNWLEGGHVTELLQLTAFVIVIGGTLGRGTHPDPVAGLPACPASPELGGGTPKPRRRPSSTKPWNGAGWRAGTACWRWKKARGPGVGFADQQRLQLLVDGLEPEEIRSVMDVEIDNAAHR